MQGQKKHYGIKHDIDGTIHYDMGDTLPSVAISLSMDDNNYSMWDKGQLLVILSRKNYPRIPYFSEIKTVL